MKSLVFVNWGLTDRLLPDCSRKSPAIKISYTLLSSRFEVGVASYLIAIHAYSGEIALLYFIPIS